MKFLCFIIGHKWESNTSAGDKVPSIVCKRCGTLRYWNHI